MKSNATTFAFKFSYLRTNPLKKILVASLVATSIFFSLIKRGTKKVRLGSGSLSSILTALARFSYFKLGSI